MSVDDIDMSWPNATDLIDRGENFPTLAWRTPSEDSLDEA